MPKTIDNDVSGTVTTFGFDTAVNTALEAIDKLHTTAESHDRVMVMEVMGRDAGFIALHAGVAGTADVILIPEIPYDIEKVCEKIRARDAAGRLSRSSSSPRARSRTVGQSHTLGESLPGQARRIGGVADAIAREIQTITGKETRSLVLGHLQRGGMPTGLRPPAGDAIRRRGGAGDRRREVGPDGRAAVAAHRHDPDRGGAGRGQAGGPDARRGADGAGDGDQLRRLRVHGGAPPSALVNGGRTLSVGMDSPTAGWTTLDRARRC